MAHRQRPGRRLHHRRPGLSQQGRHQLQRVHDLQPGTASGGQDRQHRLAGRHLPGRRAVDWKANFLYGNDYEAYLGTILLSGIASSLAPAGITLNSGQRLPRPSSRQATGRPYSTSYTGGQGLYDPVQAARHHRGPVHQQQLARHRRLRPDRRPALQHRQEGLWTPTRPRVRRRRGPGFADIAAGQQRIASGAIGRGVPGRAVRARATRRGSRGKNSPGGRRSSATCGLPWANPAVQGRGTNQKRRGQGMVGHASRPRHRHAPEVFTYASYARGYKGGGYNLDRTPVVERPCPAGGNGDHPDLRHSFPGEFVDSYEVGMKNTLFNRTVLLNPTAFYQEYSDFQLNTFLGTSPAVRLDPASDLAGRRRRLPVVHPGARPVGAERLHLRRHQVRQAGHPRTTRATPRRPRVVKAACQLASLTAVRARSTYERPVGEAPKARFNIGAGKKYSSEYNTGLDLFPCRRMQDAYTGSFERPHQRWATRTSKVDGRTVGPEPARRGIRPGRLQRHPGRAQSGLSATNKVYNPAPGTPSTYDAVPRGAAHLRGADAAGQRRCPGPRSAGWPSRRPANPR